MYATENLLACVCVYVQGGRDVCICVCVLICLNECVKESGLCVCAYV